MKPLVLSVPFTSDFLPRLTACSYTSSSLSRSPFQASYSSLIHTSCFPPAPSTPVSTAPSSPLPTYAHTLILPPHTLSAHPQSPSHPHFRLPPPLCPNTCPSLTSYSQPHGIPFPSPCILTLSSSSSYLSSVEQSHFIPRHYHITSPGISLLLLCLKRDRYPPVLLHPEFSLLKCLKLGDWVLSFHP